MNRYEIKYETYLGMERTTTIYEDDKQAAVRKFKVDHPLSKIKEVCEYEY